MPKSTLIQKAGAAAIALGLGLGAFSGVSAQEERQYLYCVASAATPGGKAYFTKVYPGTWDESFENEDAYFAHISKRMDTKVERSTTYCYALDSFDEAGLERDEGVEQIRKKGWEPVDVTWRP